MIEVNYPCTNGRVHYWAWLESGEVKLRYASDNKVRIPGIDKIVARHLLQE